MTSRPDRLAQRVVSGILEDLAGGRLGPGDQLEPEAALAERFGVSKPVVREAIAQLAVHGIAEIRRGRPTILLPLSGEPVAALFSALATAHGIGAQEFFALRRALETEAAGRAAERAGVEEAEALAAIVARMADAIRTIDPWVVADLDFHRALAGMSGQRLVALILAALETSTRATMQTIKLTRDLSAAQRSLERHVEIVAAIRARDPAAARRAMAAHFDLVADEAP